MSDSELPDIREELHLHPSAFFDLEELPWAEIFEGVERAWGVLGLTLKGHIEGKVRPGIAGRVHEKAHLHGEQIEIGPGSIVEPGAYIREPCIIGANVQVRHGAYLRGHCLIGDGAVVGHCTEVKSSIFLPGARAGHFAYIGDSILGRNTNLGAGTKLANLKLSGDEVVLRHGDEAIPTGLRKLGAVLGDGVQTGCNSVTNPGTVLGRGCLVHPCLAVSGYYPPGTVLWTG